MLLLPAVLLLLQKRMARLMLVLMLLMMTMVRRVLRPARSKRSAAAGRDRGGGPRGEEAVAVAARGRAATAVRWAACPVGVALALLLLLLLLLPMLPSRPGANGRLVLGSAARAQQRQRRQRLLRSRAAPAFLLLLLLLPVAAVMDRRPRRPPPQAGPAAPGRIAPGGGAWPWLRAGREHKKKRGESLTSRSSPLLDARNLYPLLAMRSSRADQQAHGPAPGARRRGDPRARRRVRMGMGWEGMKRLYWGRVERELLSFRTPPFRAPQAPAPEAQEAIEKGPAPRSDARIGEGACASLLLGARACERDQSSSSSPWCCCGFGGCGRGNSRARVCDEKE